MEGLAKQAIVVFVLFFLASTETLQVRVGLEWQDSLATLLAILFLGYSIRIVHLGCRGTIHYLFR